MKVVILSKIALNMIIGGAKAMQNFPLKIKLLYLRCRIRRKTNEPISDNKALQILSKTFKISQTFQLLPKTRQMDINRRRAKERKKNKFNLIPLK